MTDNNCTYAAVIRSSNDRNCILAESPDWHTRRDAELLGVAELGRKGWFGSGVLCIEERK